MTSQSERTNAAEVEGAARSNSLARPARVVADTAALNWPLVRALGFEAACADSEGRFLLSEHEGALDLRPPGEHGRRGIQASFPPDKNPPRGGRNPLVRAFGKQIHEILDLTAGLGGDAYRLAFAGHRVRACERDPAVYAVLASGWDRAQKLGLVPASLAGRLSFVHAEGADQIAALDGPNRGVYIDPMYPPARRRSAKPRRELQVLRALLGGQVDAAGLVAAARERAARVVVKRPRHAGALLPEVSFEIETKLLRLDVYVNPDRMEAGSDE